ncbi:MAG TPA: VWA domain-containing protein [Chondromyces sp.]|nr:VWA domain-containing protein [Chondromyces sp.]
MTLRTIARRTLFGAAAAIAAAAAARAAAQEPPRFGGSVEVRRILLEVRVVDAGGEPVPGLTADDFEVSIGGRRVAVESVTFVPTSAAAAGEPPEGRTAGQSVTAREPRLVVVLFQTDINLYRIKGVVRMAPQAARFVRGLEAGDLVALFTFESHLELRADFTPDRDAVARMLTTREILSGSLEPPPVAEPAVGAFLDPEDADRAATLTEALEVIGRALIPIPGPKSVVLFGWGLGRYNPGHPVIERGSYYPTIDALAAARATVFTLDITSADAHTLEAGLRTVSHDTGGLYIKTYQFPESAVDKLTRTISSYYELSLIPPEPPFDLEPFEVEVRRRGAEVYFRRSLPFAAAAADLG